MDLWSDPNLSPFMAITAHWIETTSGKTLLLKETPGMTQECLGTLRMLRASGLFRDL